ncbi:hypothetical protein AC579_2650 [Pseudocercospora musae]|uniref:Uncharacterized protein n=1 Tax=Pseudocercospora musae TaxID=113226 RepID=A0A139GT94_9PEZI|nr:hypothetical protein AC579_2650 [Pseudocercospora musae]
MPCDYKASRPALANFAHSMTTYINHLSPKDFNEVYDLLVWTPPLPHTPAEEMRNKRNLLSWIMRNYPELRHPTESMPTKALLDASMRLRTTSTTRVAQASRPARSAANEGARGNADSDGLDARMPQNHLLSQPAVRRDYTSRHIMFVQDEDNSDDELNSLSHVMKKSAMQRQHPATSWTGPAHSRTQEPLISLYSEDDDANFSDRNSKIMDVNNGAHRLPSHLDTAEDLRPPPNPQQQRLDFQDFHARNQEARPSPNHGRDARLPSNTITPPAPPNSLSDQEQDQNHTATPTPHQVKLPGMLSALTSALGNNWAQLREHCESGNLSDAINALATMTSLVVLVRDGGFDVDEAEEEEEL